MAVRTSFVGEGEPRLQRAESGQAYSNKSSIEDVYRVDYLTPRQEAILHVVRQGGKPGIARGIRLA